MAKKKTTFFCKSCGFESPKWIGKCPGCEQWNTFAEEVRVSQTPNTWAKSSRKIVSPSNINEIQSLEAKKSGSSDRELDLVLGGGIVPGSVILLGGEPGIGKSTLLLQMALKSTQSVLYISGEESESQIKLRADRVGIKNQNCEVLTETLLENILDYIKANPPEVIVVDSIQTLYSEDVDAAAGSITQIRECAGKLLHFAKEFNVPVFLVGHITKEGSIAGPKLLEHMVDTVLQFEGDRHHVYRILRTLKNRFGSTQELGIYEMRSGGLIPVDNPSEVWMSQRDEALSGISIGCVLEGIRPLMIEVQSLVSSAVYGTPQRSATGFDLRRLNMLLAVLEKRCGFRLGQSDVFVNLAGGLRLEDPALDLPMMAAIMSSYQGLNIQKGIVFSGEVGLSGEVRAVQRLDQRINEAKKLGFTDMVISKYNKFDNQSITGINLHTFGKVDEVFSWLFG